MSRWLLAIGLGVAIAAVPWLGTPYSVVGSANLAAVYALVAISLVILIGWVGQISLGHAALVGVGGYATGWITGGLGIPFPASLPFAAATAGGVAALLGMVALRVRGLYLAVATLVFSWMASEFLFSQEWIVRHSEIPLKVIGGPGVMPSFDFSDRRIFYVASWAIVGTVVLVASNLREAKTGRAFFAVRGSEMAAASLGIDVMRTKLVAFATSGAIAGLAGNLLMSGSRALTPEQFTFNWSLTFLAIAVVGGLTRLGGAIASGVVFAGLTEVFFRVQSLGGFLEITSGLLLAVTLLVYPGGLASIPILAPLHRLRGRIGPRGRSDRVEPSSDTIQSEAFSLEGATVSTNGHTKEQGSDPSSPEIAPLLLADVPREARRPLLEASGITVQFGGLVAVDDASLSVREGEIIGLIGPNGAGKTTLFNAIAGFNSPSLGSVTIRGIDATRLPVHKRAQLGVARTFQQIQLFGQLSVYDNLLVATHMNNPTGYWRHMLATERALATERDARRRVDQVLRQLSLAEVAHRRVADLSFGVLRMVEVARALVTGFPMMMLDEPASGLDHNETDELIAVLRTVRELGVAMLLIEHDVRMVVQVCDYIYVLDQGRIIAEGPPEVIQRDAAVIAAYLGAPVKEAVG